MPPKLMALGVIAIVLSIMTMVIIAPPQDTTHQSADAGDFASGSAWKLGPWGASEFTDSKRSGE